ncbi:hypothetical protein HMJ29_05490 [Hymenobacter taeanensis]|uniref:Uncharacterized protein n=1 Tax=Hymenobacter taeanensis TaxID=2735321 RepID=A0A6M6BDW0_9BACT|nr:MULTISPECIES: hypothetical protein [Hymenobacter]QJX46417.1 hypothetical protein HMJ29_05490 [Hymenobacter taeanensis]UOQ80278.1 hypothetical protein MUN83_15805 [Hymenobacter sp. 5414T-23]
MSKHKKQKKKKAKQLQEAVPENMLDAAVLSIRKFRKITNEIAKLSLGQKVVGSLVLAAAGLIYLDQRKGDDSGTSFTSRFNWPRLPEAEETAASEATEEEGAAPIREAAISRKSRKNPKASKGQTTHKSPDDTVADIRS